MTNYKIGSLYTISDTKLFSVVFFHNLDDCLIDKDNNNIHVCVKEDDNKKLYFILLEQYEDQILNDIMGRLLGTYDVFKILYKNKILYTSSYDIRGGDLTLIENTK